MLNHIQDIFKVVLWEVMKEENKKDIRQVKTDSELVLRMVVSGEYVKEE